MTVTDSIGVHLFCFNMLWLWYEKLLLNVRKLCVGGWRRGGIHAAKLNQSIWIYIDHLLALSVTLGHQLVSSSPFAPSVVTITSPCQLTSPHPAISEHLANKTRRHAAITRQMSCRGALPETARGAARPIDRARKHLPSLRARPSPRWLPEMQSNHFHCSTSSIIYYVPRTKPAMHVQSKRNIDNEASASRPQANL